MPDEGFTTMSLAEFSLTLETPQKLRPSRASAEDKVRWKRDAISFGDATLVETH